MTLESAAPELLPAEATRLAWPSEAHGLALVAMVEARFATPLAEST